MAVCWVWASDANACLPSRDDLADHTAAVDKRHRPALRVDDAQLGIDPQAVKNRGGQVRGAGWMIQRVRRVAIACAVDGPAVHAGACQHGWEQGAPMVAAPLVVSLGR